MPLKKVETMTESSGSLDRSNWHYANSLTVYDQDGKKFIVEFENRLEDISTYTRAKLNFTFKDVLTFLLTKDKVDEFDVTEDCGDLCLRQPKHVLRERIIERAQEILPDLKTAPIRVFQEPDDVLITVYFPVAWNAWFNDMTISKWFSDIDAKENAFDDDFSQMSDEEFNAAVARINP